MYRRYRGGWLIPATDCGRVQSRKHLAEVLFPSTGSI
jgi:hypothetical protein